jgi:hypothetical protein
MFQAGEDPPLALEARHRARIGGRTLEDLDRYSLLVEAVGALGEVDPGHAAASQLAEQPVRTEALARRKGAAGLLAGSSAEAGTELPPELGCDLRTVAGRLCRGEQAGERATLVGARGRAVEKRPALARGQLERAGEQVVESGAVAHRRISSASQARARCQ